MKPIDHYIELIREQAKLVVDKRVGKNAQYSIEDIVMTAFSVFLFQSPSWLDFQRHLESQGEKSNINTIMKCSKIPTDNHVRNILDGIDQIIFNNVFYKILDKFINSQYFETFTVLNNRHLIAVDGTQYFNSNKTTCDNCSIKYHKK
jgi:hypothetical protein